MPCMYSIRKLKMHGNVSIIHSNGNLKENISSSKKKYMLNIKQKTHWKTKWNDRQQRSEPFALVEEYE